MTLIDEWFSYNLTQFVMVSPEVFQDLHQRYWNALWPWLSVLILCNIVFLFKRYKRLVFAYVAFSWLFVGYVYFHHFFSEVHTFAWLVACLFGFQALIVILFQLLLQSPLSCEHGMNSVRSEYSEYNEVTPLIVKRFGLLIYFISAFIPLSLFAENSKGTLLLFGWGAEQTALGTIGLTIVFYNNKRDLLLTLIPILWLVFYLLFL